MMEKKRIAIIGAGITGLTTAWNLKKTGCEFVVFEQGEKTGGVIRTVNESGFTFECGPNTGVLSHPEAAELLEELDPECKVEIADASAKFRWIWKGRKWEPLPTGLFSAIRTPLFSLYDKIRILGEPFRKRGNDPEETLAAMVRRRLGESYLNYAVDPFILGIYAGDPARLVPKYALPKLYNLEQKYGSFIRGSICKAREPKTEKEKKATREIFSVQGGLQNLINVLTDRIGTDHILLNCKGLQIFPGNKGSFNISVPGRNTNSFSHVVVTSGSYSLEGLFPFAEKSVLGRITRLKYARVVQVSLGFNEWKGILLKAFGGLVPFCEKRDILGVLFISSFLKNRAPENGVLLSVFLGGLRKPEIADLPDEKILDLVRSEITTMMELADFSPDLIKIYRYNHAIPQYGPESADKLAAVDEFETLYPGLIIAGNTRDGIGLADRIKQGKNISLRISEDK